ncbi:MAG: zinc-binding dehydrogenase [Chloroflexota bacterium]|nr:zinc-binding dehydrogenase [Chloroflexota bacterium]
MEGVMERYQAGREGIPETMLAWPLYGTGLDSLGQDHQAVRLPVPMPGAYQLLARIDAVGLCFSDIKLIRAGGDHPRLYGRDLAADPTIPGHEVSLTIVEVGEQLGDRFHIGQRFVVQADIYYHGVNLAYGYMLRGGLAQYSLIGEEILNGDEGCYLIPIQADVGYAETALTEPWACIEASHRIPYRPGLKEGGTALFAGPCEQARYTLTSETWPEQAFLADMSEDVELDLGGELAAHGTEVVRLGDEPISEAYERRTEDQGFDDILLLGPRSAPEVEELTGYLAQGGVLSLSSDLKISPVEVDVGRFHYDDIKIVGSGDSDVTAGYRGNVRSELKPDGRAWFLGAGGPMGQMQVQRALMMEDGPRVILASNLRSGRIKSLARRFGTYAGREGIDLVCLTREEVGDVAYFDELGRLADEKGFDDIVVLAPSPRAVEEAAPYLAEGGVMNVFAGMPRGTTAQVDLGELLAREARIIGSSGSSIEDLEYTLRKAERGELQPNGSVAAIAGIEGVWEGMQALAEGRFPGKVVIYPQIEGLGLTPLDGLRSALPEVADKLENGIWTREAERRLLQEGWRRA